MVEQKLKRNPLALAEEMSKNGGGSGRKIGDVVGAGAVTGDIIVTGAETDTGDVGAVAETGTDIDTDIGEAEAGTEGMKLL